MEDAADPSRELGTCRWQTCLSGAPCVLNLCVLQTPTVACPGLGFSVLDHGNLRSEDSGYSRVSRYSSAETVWFGIFGIEQQESFLRGAALFDAQTCCFASDR